MRTFCRLGMSLALCATMIVGSVSCARGTAPRAFAKATKPTHPDGRSTLRKTMVPAPTARKEVIVGIDALIASGAVQPKAAVSINKEKPQCWLLRTSKGPSGVRWPRPLLNTRPGAPDLTIDPKLRGVYDIHAKVRAVNAGGAMGMGAKAGDMSPMEFALELDDGSRRERVGAKGFSTYHFDTEVLAGHAWPLTGRKLVVRNLGKPVYLYGFRFAPTAGSPAPTTDKKVSRWLATDHVVIARDPAKHFAFPGVALLKNGDLAVVYREGTIHGYEKTGKVSLSRSTDGGRTWLPRVTALDRPNYDDRDPTIFQMADGTTLLLSNSCICTSTDHARTWTKPLPTPVFGPKGAVEDEDGNIVYGALLTNVQKLLTRVNGRPMQLQANAVFRSRDKGRSWQKVGIATYTAFMPPPFDYIWYDEPFMCVVPDKYWIFAARVDVDGFARIIRSPDRGKTWGPVIKTPVWGYPQHLLPLRDGRLLMSYGYRRSPWGVRACLSNDNGKTWDIDNEIVLRMDAGTPAGKPRKVGNRDLGYPVSVQLHDGSMFTTYYLNKDGSNCYIAGTHWTLPPIAPKAGVAP